MNGFTKQAYDRVRSLTWRGWLGVGAGLYAANWMVKKKAIEARINEEFAKRPKIAVVPMRGVIAAGGEDGVGGGPIVNLQKFEKTLKAAFLGKEHKAVIVKMNSPGGSPVQSSLLHKYIAMMKKLHPEMPVVCFVEDVCASGGYYIASACDEIYCDESSIVGSVGVIRADFGFQGLLENVGVERRVLTAGRCKSQLDPFKEQQPRDVAVVSGIMEKLHRQFISVVKRGRGDRLKPAVAGELQREALAGLDGPVEEYEGMGLFDGSVYAGADAVRVGFADGIDTFEDYVLRKYGDEAVVIEIKPKPNVFDFLSSLGMSALANQQVLAAAQQLYDYDLWSRFGAQPPRS